MYMYILYIYIYIYIYMSYIYYIYIHIFPIAFNFLIVSTLLEKVKHYNLGNKINQLSFSLFLSGLHMKNCFPVLLCINCASATKHSLTAIILCISLCLRDFCSSKDYQLKFCQTDKSSKIHFFNIIKKAVLYVVQCIFQKNKFYFQMCYLIDFVDMKHGVPKHFLILTTKNNTNF